MININKQGNAIVIEFTDNDKYLFNGTIEVAPNELMIVIDESNMATFKRMTNGDVLFSQLIDNIQISGSPVTKDTIIEQFGLIGFSTSGGGGGGAVNSVNGQTGDVIITASSLNVYTQTEVDQKLDTKQPIGDYATTEQLNSKLDTSVYETDKPTFALKSEIPQPYTLPTASAETLGGIKVGAGLSITEDGTLSSTGTGGSVDWNDITGKPEFKTVATTGSYNDLTDKPTIPTLQSSDEGNEDNYIYSNKFSTDNIIDNGGGTPSDINTLNKNVLSFVQLWRNANTFKIRFSSWNDSTISFGSGGDWMATSSKAGFISASDKQKLDSINLDTLATKEELETKQDTLVSGTNIKTVNGISLLGEGNIELQGGGGIPDAPADGKKYVRSNNSWVEEVDISDLATKEELASKLDISTYNVDKATFETKENAAATYQPKGDYALKSDLSTLATKEELTSGLSGKADTSAIADMLTKTEASTTYATKAELGDINAILDNINGEVI